LSNIRYRYLVLGKTASNTRYSAKFDTRFSPTSHELAIAQDT